MKKFLPIIFVLVVVLAATTASASVWTWLREKLDAKRAGTIVSSQKIISPSCRSLSCRDLKKFTSAQDFLNYLKKANDKYGATSFGRGFGGGDMPVAVAEDAAQNLATKEASIAPPTAGERFSLTNVQVAGIDEADILKTNGQEIFFSPEKTYQTFLAEPEVDISGSYVKPFNPYTPKTSIVSAYPPVALSLASEINEAGDLLLSGNSLVVQSYRYLSGYDVSDAKNPKQKWTINLDEQTQIVSSRLFNDKIYLVTTTWINQSRPCPMPLYKVGQVQETLRCGDIFHPSEVLPINTTYTISIINPKTGAVERRTSLAAFSGQAVVYMSPTSIYLAYSYQADQLTTSLDFIKTVARDLYPASIISKLEKLISYDLSVGAKNTELYEILNNYQNSLTNDERLRLQNELQNRLTDYVKKNLRQLETTGIAKLDTKTLVPIAGGSVPGHPLNQFSLDESGNYLRIAVTNSGNFWFPGGANASGESASDVYVLDRYLRMRGSVKDLGKTEQIYAVRFIGDRGYVVTFRQIDPFYVLDLSSPTNPRLLGELKIPGYSGYLHPIDKTRIIGVGEEDNKVKISLFDVSNASKPQELAKYTLNEYWSEAVNNHHAFTIDTKHKVFFIPGGQGGYVLSYAGNDLILVKAIAKVQAKRALYLDDYLYIVSDNNITVIDENNWQTVKSWDHQFGNSGHYPRPIPTPMPVTETVVEPL